MPQNFDAFVLFASLMQRYKFFSIWQNFLAINFEEFSLRRRQETLAKARQAESSLTHLQLTHFGHLHSEKILKQIFYVIYIIYNIYNISYNRL
jgi:hypothetical protein